MKHRSKKYVSSNPKNLITVQFQGPRVQIKEFS